MDLNTKKKNMEITAGFQLPDFLRIWQIFR